MKKHLFLLLLVPFILLTCQLADSGRKSSLELTFSQPDIMDNLLTPSENRERIILSVTSKIEIVLYKPYSQDPLDDSNILETFDELDQILARPETQTITLTTDGGLILDHTISNIEPGTWNILVGTFIQNGRIWSNGEISELMTYRLKRNVELQAGMNWIELPLKLNQNNYYTYINSYTAVGDLDSGEGTSGDNFILDDPIVGMIYATGFNIAETHIIPSDTAYISSYRFFDGEGRILDLNFSGSYWSWNPEAGSNDLIILVEYPTAFISPLFTIYGYDYSLHSNGFYELTVRFFDQALY